MVILDHMVRSMKGLDYFFWRRFVDTFLLLEEVFDAFPAQFEGVFKLLRHPIPEPVNQPCVELAGQCIQVDGDEISQARAGLLQRAQS